MLAAVTSVVVLPHSSWLTTSGIISSRAAAAYSLVARADTSWYSVLIGRNWLPVMPKMRSRPMRPTTSSITPSVRAERYECTGPSRLPDASSRP